MLIRIIIFVCEGTLFTSRLCCFELRGALKDFVYQCVCCHQTWSVRDPKRRQQQGDSGWQLEGWKAEWDRTYQVGSGFLCLIYRAANHYILVIVYYA